MTSETPMDHPADRGKPRIMLLGEFSAGKSTLANALLKCAKSPVRVTATQVPPIWYTLGDGAPVRITRDGTEIPLDSDDLSEAPLDDTRAVRVYLQSDFLEMCDLIDMPGSSDPNMTAEVWDAMLPQADGVIWCTPATQAWRQSEAAIWEGLADSLHHHSVLLVTRIDKVRSPEDRQRVITRVARETQDMFRGVFPVSATEALAAGEDAEKWAASGMAPFSETFLEIVEEIERGVTEDPTKTAAALRKARSEGPGPAFGLQEDPWAEPAPEPAAAEPETPPRRELRPQPAPAEPRSPSGIMPRRVSNGGGGRRVSARPTGTDGSLI